MIFINFTSDSSQPADKDDLEDLLFTDPDSVSNFFSQQSNGAVTLTGSQTSMFGYYTLSDVPSPCPSNALPPWVGNGIDAAEAASSYRFNNYAHTIVYSPSTACSYAGIASTPGRIVYVDGLLDKNIYAHELGHNMGLNHANLSDCIGCPSQEYLDPFDTMGYNQYRNFSGFHRKELGFPAGEVVASTSGTYGLSASAGTRTLSIPRGAAGGELSLEIRSGSNPFDGGIDAQAQNGVSIRWARQGVLSPLQTNLIDTTPGGAAEDAPLDPGQVFADVATGIKITNLSSALGVAQVRVDVPTATPGAQPPAPAQTGSITKPKFKNGKAKIPKNGKITYSFPAAGKLVFKLGGKSKTFKNSTATYTIAKKYRKKKSGTLKITASGGSLANPVAKSYKLKKGVIKG